MSSMIQPVMASIRSEFVVNAEWYDVCEAYLHTGRQGRQTFIVVLSLACSGQWCQQPVSAAAAGIVVGMSMNADTCSPSMPRPSLAMNLVRSSVPTGRLFHGPGSVHGLSSQVVNKYHAAACWPAENRHVVLVAYTISPYG